MTAADQLIAACVGVLIACGLAGAFLDRLHRRNAGRIRYVKGSPLIIGDIQHFLPLECWTDDEKQRLRFRIHKERWAGSRWERVETYELTRSELAMMLERFPGDFA